MDERLKHTGGLLQIDKNQFTKIPLCVPEKTQDFEEIVDDIHHGNLDEEKLLKLNRPLPMRTSVKSIVNRLEHI